VNFELEQIATAERGREVVLLCVQQGAMQKVFAAVVLENKTESRMPQVYDSLGAKKMNVQFLLFVIAILLLLIFWELSKINSRLKKTLVQNQDIRKVNKHAEF